MAAEEGGTAYKHGFARNSLAMGSSRRIGIRHNKQKTRSEARSKDDADTDNLLELLW